MSDEIPTWATLDDLRVRLDDEKTLAEAGENARRVEHSDLLVEIMLTVIIVLFVIAAVAMFLSFGS